ncbi:MAG: hypothetical protein P9M14_15435 [Candidatus Alcyoniella australis]|nr:hypothetical protein [Candidatus Alcyoniella australis]
MPYGNFSAAGFRFFLSILVLLTLLCATGCDRGDFDPPSDLPPAHNPGGDGPHVVFQPDSHPMPLLPFPNDILTRLDPSTPTGLRLDLPTVADTEFERMMRRRLNRLDGFGAAMPLTVSFDAPLNIETIDQRTALLIDIDPDSPDYGAAVPLDLGLDQYPMVLEKPVALFPLDEHNEMLDMIFAPGNRRTYYEDETDTLILKPIVPLLPATRYAVILTDGLRDDVGEPIQPPDGFEYIYFPQQQQPALEAIELADERFAIAPKHVAFCWVFTTQSISEDLVMIRDGLDGEGPLARLLDEFPQRIEFVDPLSVEIDGDGNQFILQSESLQSAFDALLSWSEELPGIPFDFPYGYWSDFQYIDYFAAGRFVSPFFLGSAEGIFEIDRNSGEADYTQQQVPFLITVPKPCEANGWAQPPYPVVLFQHGNERNRDDMVLVANAIAKYGFATISMDAAGHGPEGVVDLIDKYINQGIDDPEGPMGKLSGWLMRWFIGKFYPSMEIDGLSLEQLHTILIERTLFGAMTYGRATDSDGDGVRDSGEEFFTADVFLTRDMVRQSVVDQMLFVRIAQQLGSDFNNNGLLDLDEGDFNLDGVLDLGGPNNPIYYVGTSMGGILGSVFLGVENRVTAGVVNVPGGILTELVVRSNLASVATRVFYEILGPRIVGEPNPLDPQVTLLRWNKDLILDSFDSLVLEPGWIVVLSNQVNGLSEQFEVTADRAFQVGVASDQGDPLTLLVYDGPTIVERREYLAPTKGLNMKRNTPEMRNFLGLAQMCVDAGDPVNYAPLWNLRTVGGNEPKNVLVQIALGDYTVPVATGLAVARAGGVLSLERSIHLARLGVMLGWDKYTPFDALNEPFESTSGSGLRIHPSGNHAYLYWPSAWDPNQVRYTFAVKEQIMIYLQSDGELIEDNMDVLLADYPDL